MKARQIIDSTVKAISRATLSKEGRFYHDLHERTGYRVYNVEALCDSKWVSMNRFKFRLPESRAFYCVKEGRLVEAVDFVFQQNGGIIVFSVDVNAARPTGEGVPFLSRLKNWLANKLDSIVNRFRKTSKLDTAVKAAAKAYPDEEVVGFSLGNFFTGRYQAKDGSMFNETSTSLEIIGVSAQLLITIATEIAREFQQETVLVKDYSSNNIMLVNQK